MFSSSTLSLLMWRRRKRAWKRLLVLNELSVSKVLWHSKQNCDLFHIWQKIAWSIINLLCVCQFPLIHYKSVVDVMFYILIIFSQATYFKTFLAFIFYWLSIPTGCLSSQQILSYTMRLCQVRVGWLFKSNCIAISRHYSWP